MRDAEIANAKKRVYKLGIAVIASTLLFMILLSSMLSTGGYEGLLVVGAITILSLTVSLWASYVHYFSLMSDDNKTDLRK